MFVNTLALRNFPEPSKLLSVFVQEVKENVLGALEHQEYQFDELIQKLNMSKTRRINPLFEVMFQMQKNTQTKFSLPELEIDVLDINLTSEFIMTFSITEYDDRLLMKIIYRKNLFNKETVQQILALFEGILVGICTTPQSNRCLGEIGINVTDQAKGDTQSLDIQFHFG